MLYITLNQILAADPCSEGLARGMAILGEGFPEDQEISMLDVVDKLSIRDALWCLSTFDGSKKHCVLIAVAYAESVIDLFNTKYPTDNRPNAAIQAARTWLAANATAAYAAYAANATAYAAYDSKKLLRDYIKEL